ncbi:MAG: HAMP domain-containing histidine kinase [Methylobacteriaceae bacterium]|nr:HAMP domain-containing histidine kinase [Methylobacteriaceae bacterium]
MPLSSAAPPPPTPPRRLTLGLRARMLLLTAGFVLLAEVAVYIPSIANFRNGWLNDRLAAARTAALVFDATEREMIPEELARRLLASVGAHSIALKTQETRRLLAVSETPQRMDERFDLRDPTAAESIAAAFRTLLAPQGRVIGVVGAPAMGGEFVEITLEETPLKEAMRRYSINILLLSLAISATVAGLAMFAIQRMVLKPVRRLTSSLVEFGADPEDGTRIITPSGQGHEIGRAEEALAEMQKALAREFQQRRHLAALGLAVAKINHDLRNMLASAQLVSDRLAALDDPLARRLAPTLVATLDRAIAFCRSTLTYGRAIEPPPRIERIAFLPLAAEAAETIRPSAPEVAIRIVAAEDFRVNADPEQLYRILLNLIRNAAEALTAAGAAQGAPAITVSARREATAAVIDVADNGPGVPEPARATLFQAFHATTRPGGSGLGLAIAADLARAHGGRLELAESAAGALFRLTLPAREG